MTAGLRGRWGPKYEAARPLVLWALLAASAALHASEGTCTLGALTAPDLVIEDARPVRFEKDITRKAMAHTAADPAAFRIKVRRAGAGVSSFNNEPRYELAAYELSRLLFPADEQVVPPIALRSAPLDAFRRIDPAAVEAWSGTDGTFYMVQCWLDGAKPHPLRIDGPRFAADPAYARAISRLNVLTYLVEHKDSNLGNVMLTGEGATVRAWAIDNGVAFDSEESDVGTFWKNLRVDAVDRVLADRLHALTLGELRAHLAVIAQYELVGEAWVSRPDSANFDALRGVRRKGGQVQLGLTSKEIGEVERRRVRLVHRIDKGDIRILPDAS
ncbi:MAG: hypothetical protein CMLOHMNK_02464 [Steroidobacteraceae bacterium]|nr:hypothetical protein [Steroidobacteraceae bacterium]